MPAKLVGTKPNPLWLLGLLGAACGHGPAPCPVPEPLPVVLRADERLNLHDGQGLPTTVRLYQLKDGGRLATATLEQMLENDRAVLGEDLLSVREITLYPGEVAKPLVDRRDGAGFLAVVAFFHHPVGSGWRATAKLPPTDADYCHAESHGRGVFFSLLESQISWKGVSP